MATNPNAIFGEALATGPRQVPLSELQQQIANTRQTQAQTANIGSEMAQRQQETLGLQQQNTLRQRQIDDEQAVRDALKNNTKTFPVTAPSAAMPSPGTDENGNPLPMSSDQHAQAAANAVQGTHTNWDGVYADLLSQGRVSAAETLRKTRQAYDTQDLENTKTKLAIGESQNKRRAEILAGVVSAPPEQQDLLAVQAGIQLQQEGLGGGVGFTANQAKAGYQLAKGAGNPIREALDKYGLSEAEASQRVAEAEKTREETKQYKLANDASEQFLKNPDAVLAPGGMIDQIGLDPADAKTIKGAVMAAFQMPGTFQEKAGAVKAALNDGVKSVLDARRQKRLATDPDILAAKAKEGALGEAAKAGLTGGPVAGILNPTLQKMALDEQAKAEDEWNKAKGQADQLQSFVDLARSPQGNQVAAGVLPVAVIRDLVNRVNKNELKLSGGGLSVARRLENWVSTGAQGKPSEDTLKDMEAFGNAVIGAKDDAYRRSIAGIKRRFPQSTFSTEPPETPTRTASPAPAAQPATGGPVTVMTKAAYDALPAGTPYVDPDGKHGIKGQK